jgi:hypothetical protein
VPVRWRPPAPVSPNQARPLSDQVALTLTNAFALAMVAPMTAAPEGDRKEPKAESEMQLPWPIWLFPAAGAPGVLVYSLAIWDGSVLGVSLMVAVASLVVGILLGFLFSIPRELPTAAPLPDGQGDERSAAGRVAQAITYAPNTNLGQISDWLTKILVGVGLVQFGHLRHSVGDLVRFLGPSLGNGGTGRAFALALFFYYLVSGFLAGYLFTRLQLPSALAQADRLSSKVERVELEVGLLRTSEQTIALVTAQLEDPASPVDQATLDKAIQDASRSARVQIFYRAQRQRRQNWWKEETKPRVESAVPIFRALIASDPERQFHRNYAELGFALKDQPRPDWAGAEAALDEAIAIRDRLGHKGNRIYEFNRAVARIHLDPDFRAKRASSPEAHDRIVADLMIAGQGKYSVRAMKGDPAVAEWAELNSTDIEALIPRRD